MRQCRVRYCTAVGLHAAVLASFCCTVVQRITPTAVWLDGLTLCEPHTHTHTRPILHTEAAAAVLVRACIILQGLCVWCCTRSLAIYLSECMPGVPTAWVYHVKLLFMA
jgi:hypothetical protein